MSREAVLRPLFVSLPTPRGTDAEGLLTGYFVALEGLPLNAVQSVVMKLVKGTWSEPVTFCPRPPELATMVRKEYEFMRARSAPAVSHLPAPHSFKDLRVTHRERARELAGKGFVKVAEGVDHLEFAQLARSRELPAGAVHLWAIDEVWSPIAVRVNRKSINERLSAKEPAMSPERAADLARMLALPDAKEITAEQMEYRRKIETELNGEEPAPATNEQAA